MLNVPLLSDVLTAADLDHTNDRLRSSLVDWMKWLQHDIGFQGWRFDFVKGYGPEYMSSTVVKPSETMCSMWESTGQTSSAFCPMLQQQLNCSKEAMSSSAKAIALLMQQELHRM